MKTIKLIDRQIVPARKTLIDVMSQHGARGITIGEIRNCVNVISKLESAKDSVDLEDAEHAVLLRYFDQFQFALAHPDIVALHDDLKGAAS
jgi:hypothetical protein